MRKYLAVSLVCITAFAPAFAQAQEGGGDAAPLQLDYVTGTVTVGDDLATIQLPQGYHYLRAEGARYVLEDLWGNPPDTGVLGMIAPVDVAVDQDGGWAIFVSYEKDGHVDDEDAAKIDYEELLESMQADTEANNEYRREHGYPAIQLLGWAEAPHYDATDKKLYWAKKLMFEGSGAPTLNYDIRILGREGVLVFNAVAGIDQLGVVAAASREILPATDFTPGNRYTDFRPGVDKVAAYGIGGLIAGKVLAKAGLFKLVAAFIKPIIVGVGVLLFGVFKFLKRDKGEQPAAS